VTIELNEYGTAVWRHKEDKNLFIERPYNWCDRIIMLDETESRKVVQDTKFTTFDFTDWIPVTVEEYKKVKQFNKDIYDNGRSGEVIAGAFDKEP